MLLCTWLERLLSHIHSDFQVRVEWTGSHSPRLEGVGNHSIFGSDSTETAARPPRAELQVGILLFRCGRKSRKTLNFFRLSSPSRASSTNKRFIFAPLRRTGTHARARHPPAVARRAEELRSPRHCAASKISVDSKKLHAAAAAAANKRCSTGYQTKKYFFGS